MPFSYTYNQHAETLERMEKLDLQREAFAKERKARGLSQRAVAERIMLPQKRISEFEQGMPVRGGRVIVQAMLNQLKIWEQDTAKDAKKVRSQRGW